MGTAEARREYEEFREQNVRDWLSERVVVNPIARTPIALVTKDYTEWCKKRGFTPSSAIIFNVVLEAEGFVRWALRVKGKVCKVWLRLELR